MAEIRVIEGRQKRIEQGHPWVYKTEIVKIHNSISPGDIVDVIDFRNRFLGKGFINPRSMITVRMLTQKGSEDISEKLIRQRIKAAWIYRQRLYKTDCPDNCRVIFGEADFLPGLIVDKFNTQLVIQILALGMAQWQDIIIDELITLIKPTGIYERNDQSVREIEGLEMRKGCLYGECDQQVTINENGVKILVDIDKGQKTGYFLDQKENRAALGNYVTNMRVLDCFCHTGSFALHASHYGAKEVHALDISSEAIDMAQQNAELNSITNITFTQANAFDKLREMSDENKEYNVVILDPPAFTKSKSTLKRAVKGYKEINLRAMKLLPPGGILISNSCSYYMSEELFLQTLLEAAKDLKRRIRLIELRKQAKDHPILLGYPESYYLKCLIMEIC